MKEDNLSKPPSIQNCNSKQQRVPSSSRKIVALQSLESQKLEDAMQSSIAQEEVVFSELKRKQQLKKKSFRLPDSSHNQPAQNLLGKFSIDINSCNSHLLLGESISKRTEIVSINEIKRYEEIAKIKREGYRFPEKLDFTLKVNGVSSPKNSKSLKKSLSSSKFARQKLNNMEEKQKSVKNQQSRQQNEIKENLSSSHAQSVKSLQSPPVQKSPQIKQITYKNSAYTLYPIAVPFSFENINTTINKLQSLEVYSNSQRSQVQSGLTPEEKEKKNLKKNNTRENKLLKQLSSSRYFIDVALDMNEFSYQLDIEVNLEKNRGFQVCLVCPERKSDGIYFKDLMHFRYEMVKLPPNMLRLRVYLLIEKDQNPKNSQRPSSKEQDIKSLPTQQQRDWKVWKQIQIPIINSQKTTSEHGSNNKNIKVSIINIDLNWVLVKINNMIEFNLKLNHQEVSVGYYCLSEDFNGVQFTKLSLSGKEKTKTTEELLGQGCQGKCQLI